MGYRHDGKNAQRRKRKEKKNPRFPHAETIYPVYDERKPRFRHEQIDGANQTFLSQQAFARAAAYVYNKVPRMRNQSGINLAMGGTQSR